MCLYPKLIRNKKYLPNKKNGGNPPPCPDKRLYYVTAACGECLECRKQKATQWQVRMSEELKENPNAYFITLTIDDNSYNELATQVEILEENNIATLAIRRCLERIRKETKKSVKHWFTTELGHEKTERLHLHGIVWGIGTDELIRKHWKYGFVFIGTHVNDATIKYITKYITKEDTDHKGFTGKILCSTGIGSNYTNREDAKNNKYKGKETNETYRLSNGTKLNLPTYYRNKILSEEEREALWLNKIEKGIIYVMGEPVQADDEQGYIKLLEFYRQKAERLGCKTETDWNKEKYIRRLQRQRKAQLEQEEKDKLWYIQLINGNEFQEDTECPF